MKPETDYTRCQQEFVRRCEAPATCCVATSLKVQLACAKHAADLHQGWSHRPLVIAELPAALLPSYLAAAEKRAKWTEGLLKTALRDREAALTDLAGARMRLALIAAEEHDAD